MSAVLLAALLAAAPAIGAAPPAATPAATAEAPAAAKARALLVVACDDRATIHINGENAGEITQWDLPFKVDVSRDVFPMIVAVEAQNLGGPGALVGALRRDGGGAAAAEVAASWRCSSTAEQGWLLPDFFDEHWAPAADVTPFGAPPWGNTAGAGLERASPVWLRPPAKPNQMIFCRWRIDALPPQP